MEEQSQSKQLDFFFKSSFGQRRIPSLKTNIEPENRPLEKEIPIGNHPFSGAMLVSGSVQSKSKTFLFRRSQKPAKSQGYLFH